MPITIYTDEDEEVTLPTKYAVCPRCRGKGSHVNPAIDGNGLTHEDFDADPDFFEDYMSGVYDVACYECKGLRVVEVLDEDRCEPWQIRKHHQDLQDEANYRAEVEMERRMGC